MADAYAEGSVHSEYDILTVHFIIIKLGPSLPPLLQEEREILLHLISHSKP